MTHRPIQTKNKPKKENEAMTNTSQKNIIHVLSHRPNEQAHQKMTDFQSISVIFSTKHKAFIQISVNLSPYLVKK